MSFLPTAEEAMREHRQRMVRVSEVLPGDQVELAGWPALVRHSEPWSDFIWFVEVDGHYADGDAFSTSFKIPVDVKLRIRRRPRTTT